MNSDQYAPEKLGLPEAHRLATGNRVVVAVIDSEVDAAHPDLAGAIVTANFDAVGQGQAARPRHRHGGSDRGPAHVLGTAPRVGLLTVNAFSTKASERRRHHVQHPQGARLGGRARRAHHQYELCRPARSAPQGRAAEGLQEGHRAGRGRRQRRAEFAAAVSGRRSERDRRDGDRRRRRAVHGRQPRQPHRGRGARRRRAGAGARAAPISSPPERRSRPRK